MNIRDLLNDNTPSISVTMTVSDFQDLIKQTVMETVASITGAVEEAPTWLTPKQVCERLKKDRATLWRWEKQGYLCGKKFGNRVRYKLSDIERIETAES